MKIILYLILFGVTQNCFAQLDSTKIHLKGEVLGLVSSGKLNSLYSYSNKWGVVDPFVDNQMVFHLKADYSIIKKRTFSSQIGIGGVLNNHLSKSFLHELYLKGHVSFIDYSIGKEAHSTLSINDQLTTGMFLNSANSAPYPRILLGVFSYTNVPYTKGWVQYKGGIGQGVLDDERESYGKSYTLLHEKYFYLRLGNTKFQPYVGLMHSALFGGKDSQGNRIPIDYFATFLSKGSEKLGGGEATNAAGAHMGFYDFGIYAKLELADVQFYYQKPIRDGSSLYINKGQNKDHIIGLIVNLKHFKYIKTISLEAIKTTYQSGPGMLDLAYPKGHSKEGQLIFPSQITDYDNFMLEEFGMAVHGWDKETFVSYFQQTYNHGYEYGGRDNYMNNGAYFKGWSYRNQSMGSPLLQTLDQFNAYTGTNLVSPAGYFVNTRVYGWHLGLAGELSPKLSYLAKLTFSKNYGSYHDEYIGGMSWDETPNYYFKNGRIETYSYLQISACKLFSSPFDLNVFVGYDWGELYYTLSTGISLVYKI